MRFLKICLIVMLSVGICVISATSLCADQTSELILKLLIKKGIITQREVDELKAEVEKDVPRGIEERATKLEAAPKTPKWVEGMELKGDLRLRQQNDWGDRTSTLQHRARLRFGFDTNVTDDIKVGAGLASGSSDDPTGTNQTLETSFQKFDIWWDLGYARYTPYDWLKLEGGKFKNPFLTTDLLWDSDVNPNGAYARLNYDIYEDTRTPVNIWCLAGLFPLDYTGRAARDTVWMAGYQGGVTTKFEEYAKLKAGVAYYDFHSLQGKTTASLAESDGGNSLLGTAWRYDYRVISPSAVLEFSDPFGIGVPVALVGQWAVNTAVSGDDNAWRLGGWLGKEKVDKRGQWKLLAQYSRLEADAFVDIFPDADLYDGGTDNKGWELIADYGVFDNVIFSVDYYFAQNITGDEQDEHALQTDLIFKF